MEEHDLDEKGDRSRRFHYSISDLIGQWARAAVGLMPGGAQLLRYLDAQRAQANATEAIDAQEDRRRAENITLARRLAGALDGVGERA